MKNCTDCKWADWRKTAAGKLHPSGSGWCKKEVVFPKLPASKYFISGSIPSPSGGHISRHEELNEHCVYFERKEPA